MKKYLYIVILFILYSISVYSDGLLIFGNKDFSFKDISLNGDKTRFFLENPDLQEGNSIDQSLKLKIMGNITDQISINATFDDTKIQNDNREITLFLTGKKFKGSVGDILSTFKNSDIIFFNKKSTGFEVKDYKDSLYFLYSKSEGKTYSEVFQGKGNQQEYRLAFYPLVKGSETIIVDNKILVKGTDYEIDYEDGTVYFENIVLPIESSSKIFINYQYIEDEKVFKRNIIGASLKQKFRKNIEWGINFFEEADSENKLIADAPDSIKPTSHTVYSYFFNQKEKDYFLKYEKAFCEIDNNLYSDDGVLDKPVKTEALMSELKISKNKYNLIYKYSERDPGFKVLGKEETSVNLEDITGILNYKGKNNSFSYEGRDYKSIVYNDPFLGVAATSPETFDTQADNVSYSFGKKMKLTGYNNSKEKEGENGDIFSENINSTTLNIPVKNKTKVFLTGSEDELVNLKTDVYTKDMTKLEGGFSVELDQGKFSYVYSDIDDMNNNIINQNINSEYFSDRFSAYVSLKLRKESNARNRIGDINLTYDFTDDFRIQYRYNASGLIEIKDSQEVNVENYLYNYKVDYSSDFYNINYFLNERKKMDQITENIENRNLLHNFDVAYNPFSLYSYRYRMTLVDNNNYISNIFVKETKNKFDISRNLNDRMNIVYSIEYDRKDDNTSLYNNYSSTGNILSFKKTGTKLEYVLSLKHSNKKYNSLKNAENIIVGDEIKYNLGKNVNIKYVFSIRDEKSDKLRRYLEDEISYNKNINSKTFIKAYLKRREVPENENGPAYSYNMLGFSFDTNF